MPATATPASPDGSNFVQSLPPIFGERRKLACPPLERFEITAADGTTLLLHRVQGGSRGPVVISPGTAMTALTYCLDTVEQNFVEFLAGEGFDVWLFDWRTSPLLGGHKRPYTLDDVGHYDWPAAISEVRKRTGEQQVSVLAHCLSSPCFLLSLVRGHTPPEHVRSFVASQVALDLVMTPVGRAKLKTFLEKILPGGDMIHQKPAESGFRVSDLAVSVLAKIIPKSYHCDNPVCPRHSASFGDVVFHDRLNPGTHALMGDLIPECLTAFLKDVAIWGRRQSLLEDEDRKHLDRLRVPIHFISGSENKMFIPESTERTYNTLRDANGPESYRRTVYPGFGHLDCYIGDGAAQAIWPDLAKTLG